MNFAKPLLVAAAMTVPMTGVGAAAWADETDGARILRALQRFSAQYVLMITRTFVDLTYDTLTIEPGTNDLILSGLTLYPALDWDEKAECRITVDRVVAADFNSLDHIETMLEVSGVHAPTACFDPMIGGTLAGVGYDGLTADTMSIAISYDLPSAAADITVQASVVDAGDISLSAAFDYLWVRIDPAEGDEPVPAAWLREAEVSFENNGLWEVLEPLVAAQFGDVNALPQMAQLLLSQALTDGGTRAPSPEESAFVENLTAELTRFLAEKTRIVVTAAPSGGVWLDANTFRGGPASLISVLQPKVSGVPLALRTLVDLGDLKAALAGTASDAADRLRIGEALITGLGAPRSLSDGKALLMPLADDWDGRAALLVSEVLAEEGDTVAGYQMALRALAAGESGATSHADTLEAAMDSADVLRLQGEAMTAWPGNAASEAAIAALIDAADVAGLRRTAYAAALGKDRPRAYRTAYFLSSLAAAAGDRGAASLRERLDRRFANRDDSGWANEASGAANEALDVWMNTLGAKVAASVR